MFGISDAVRKIDRDRGLIKKNAAKKFLWPSYRERNQTFRDKRKLDNLRDLSQVSHENKNVTSLRKKEGKRQ